MIRSQVKPEYDYEFEEKLIDICYIVFVTISIIAITLAEVYRI